MSGNVVSKVLILLITALFGVAVLVPMPWAWGFNHLQFLPDIYTTVYLIIACVVVLTLLAPRKFVNFDSIANAIDSAVFSRPKLVLYVIIGVSLLAFWLLRSGTHFLGDGYTWLSNFGLKEVLITKDTEPLSIPFIRFLQWVFGGYDKSTALLSFQIVSVVSGGIVIYNIWSIVGMLFEGNRLRLVALSTLLLSGSLVLFFGYVEFYPMLWAAGTTFVHVAIKYLHSRVGLPAVLLCFVIAVAVHLQALYLSIALLWLVIHKRVDLREYTRDKKRFWLVVSISGLMAILVYQWGYNHIGFLRSTFLPILSDRHRNFQYALFNFAHLRDVVVFSLLMYPALLVFLVLYPFRQGYFKREPSYYFLLLASAGSLTFLLVVNPVIGMARDWDLMSFTLFPPTLFLLYMMGRNKLPLSGRISISIVLICMMASIFYVAVNTNVSSAESRFHSLLKYYEDKDRNGWVVLGAYYDEKGDKATREAIIQEADVCFPNYALLLKGIACRDMRKIGEAMQIAQRLVALEPDNSDFLNLLGNVYADTGNFAASANILGKAAKLKPLAGDIRSSLGQVNIALGQYPEAIENLTMARKLNLNNSDIVAALAVTHLRTNNLEKAEALSDTLLMGDRNSPAGHLLKMMISLRLQRTETARFHFNEYKKFGVNRAEYSSILREYGFLSE